MSFIIIESSTSFDITACGSLAIPQIEIEGMSVDANTAMQSDKNVNTTNIVFFIYLPSLK